VEILSNEKLDTETSDARVERTLLSAAFDCDLTVEEHRKSHHNSSRKAAP